MNVWRVVRVVNEFLTPVGHPPAAALPLSGAGGGLTRRADSCRFMQTASQTDLGRSLSAIHLLEDVACS